MLDAARDLVLGSSCVGCGRPGRVLCTSCRAGLEVVPGPAWPTPVPPGLTDPWAATAYDGTVRAMVVGHKEHRLLALARPLGDLLAAAVGAALADLVPEPAPLVLVPVPSRPATVRAR
ncbi:MAG: ComF family protein, partial [Nocardioides sp.]|nr:ComF family protein [Nocardioides sp.]